MSTVTVQQRPRQYPAWNHLAHGGGELAGSRRIAGGDIGGKLRFKYFRRPMVPYLQVTHTYAHTRPPVALLCFLAVAPCVRLLGLFCVGWCAGVVLAGAELS